MAQAYWVATHRSVSNPETLVAYAKLSGAAVTKAGGRILVRGLPAHVYEAGLHGAEEPDAMPHGLPLC